MAIAPTDSMWNLLDTDVVGSMQTTLGAGSGILDELTEIVVGEIWNPEHVTEPFCLIRSFSVGYSPEALYPHGDQEGHIDDMVYSYDIFMFLTDTDEFNCRVRTITLLEELRQLARKVWLGWSFTAPTGEYLQRVVLDRAEIQIRGMGAHQGTYMGSSMFSVNFYTSI